MPREKKDRFVACIPLYVNEYAYKRLTKRFNVAHHIYNCFLGECEKRRRAMQRNPCYKQANIEKFEKKDIAAAKKLYKQAEIESGYYIQSGTDGKQNSLEQFAGRTIQESWLSQHIDSHTRNKLMERAFAASTRTIYGQKTKNKKTGRYERPKARFKSFTKHPLTSVEAKNFKSPLRIDLGKQAVTWSGLALPLNYDDRDQKIKHALSCQIMYIRLKRKFVGNKWNYFADLICNGFPYKKEKHVLGKGTVGIDLGPSSIAFVGDKVAGLQTLSIHNHEQWLALERKIRRLQRQLSRQAIANNPSCFNDNGTIKKGSRFIASKRQKRIQQQLADLLRRKAELRKACHGTIANSIRAAGDKIKIDNDSKKSWQMGRYGKSIGKHAPGMLETCIKNKFDVTEGEFETFSNYETRSSQLCPGCGKILKKQLKERIHRCSCGFEMQRDIVSAINLKFYKEVNGKVTFDAGKAKRFIKGKKPVLQACIKRITQSARAGHHLPTTFGTLPELERIACNDTEVLR